MTTVFSTCSQDEGLTSTALLSLDDEEKLVDSPISTVLPVVITTLRVLMKEKPMVPHLQSLEGMLKPLTSCTSALRKRLPVARLKVESVGGGTVKEETFESSHPYQHSADDFYEVKLSGANELKITFDDQTATEAKYDYVQFFKDDSKTEVWGAEGSTGGKFSGRQGSRRFPGLDGYEPLIITADSFWIYFHSDGDANDWGWKFTAEGTFPTIDQEEDHWIVDLDSAALACAADLALLLISAPSLLDPQLEEQCQPHMNMLHVSMQTKMTEPVDVTLIKDLMTWPLPEQLAPFVANMRKLTPLDQVREINPRPCVTLL